MPDDVFGFLNIDKPSGMTSHDVVARVRRQLKVKKVGHAGTLDPMATGVLIVCLGLATRLSEYAMASTKGYRAVVHLGITTDTYDAEGEVIATQPAEHITQMDVEHALAPFRGQIEQLPPMYSAVKQKGRKLYELAREGQEVTRNPRPVTIESLKLTEWTPPKFVLDVVCSSGTYIRSLAYDIGEALGVGAHLAGLVRTASGRFHLEDAVALDAVLEDEEWQRYVLPPDTALQHLPVLQLDDEQTAHVLHGRQLSRQSNDEYVRAYSHDGQFIAILKSRGTVWHPHKVFHP